MPETTGVKCPGEPMDPWPLFHTQAVHAAFPTHVEAHGGIQVVCELPEIL